MSDLELGEEVEFIKGMDDIMVGARGTVDSRVSGGYKIKIVEAVMGLPHTRYAIVGAVDWKEYVRRKVIQVPGKSPVPETLKKWYTQTQHTIKNT